MDTDRIKEGAVEYDITQFGDSTLEPMLPLICRSYENLDKIIEA